MKVEEKRGIAAEVLQIKDSRFRRFYLSNGCLAFQSSERFLEAIFRAKKSRT